MIDCTHFCLLLRQPIHLQNTATIFIVNRIKPSNEELTRSQMPTNTRDEVCQPHKNQTLCCCWKDSGLNLPCSAARQQRQAWRSCCDRGENPHRKGTQTPQSRKHTYKHNKDATRAVTHGHQPVRVCWTDKKKKNIYNSVGQGVLWSHRRHREPRDASEEAAVMPRAKN